MEQILEQKTIRLEVLRGGPTSAQPEGRELLAPLSLSQTGKSKVRKLISRLNGRDPLAYIISANIARRNLTKGQQAMGLAMMYPEGVKGKRSTETVHFSNFQSAAARSRTRTTLASAPGARDRSREMLTFCQNRVAGAANERNAMSRLPPITPMPLARFDAPLRGARRLAYH
jgi:hypothetical protein